MGPQWRGGGEKPEEGKGSEGGAVEREAEKGDQSGGGVKERKRKGREGAEEEGNWGRKGERQ